MRDLKARYARHIGVMESHKILSDFLVEIRKRHNAIPPSIFGGPKPAHRQLAAVGEALAELGGLLEAHATDVFNDTAPELKITVTDEMVCAAMAALRGNPAWALCREADIRSVLEAAFSPQTSRSRIKP